MYNRRQSAKRKLFGGKEPAYKKMRMAAYKKTALATKVSRLIAAQEIKNFDVSGTFNTVAATATITALSSITVGDTSNTRDGRKVLYKSIQGRYHLNGASAQYWRVIVLYDSQPNAATPTAAEILEAPTDALSPLSLTWSKRFQVLHDNMSGYGQQTAGTLSSGTTSGVCKWYKKLELPAEYGAVAAPTTGGLVMLTIASGVMGMNHYHRVRFADS